METILPQLIWNDSFTTGVREIDEQHMILVNILNEASVKLARDSSRELLQTITQDLLAYALYHFEEEEGLMQKYGYEHAHPEELKAHLAQHRDFSKEVLVIREQLKLGKAIPYKELLEFLNQWLVNHIMNTDKHLGAFILLRQEPDSKA